MPEPTEEKAPVAPTVEQLQAQIANLEKGIASERTQRKDLETKFTTADSELRELKAKVEKGNKTPVDLKPEDEEKLEAFARKKGFVTANELQSERARLAAETMKSIESQAITEFLEKHPEADDDGVWAKVQAEFQLYKQPASLKAYKDLLGRVWKDVNDEPGKDREEGKAAAKAEALAKSRLALGGGAQPSESDDDESPESLQKKYPHLSKDQIAARKAEMAVIIKERTKK
jgi:mRNA-degrading endonuclease HigB of HigAB toxin-antitoxin module